MQKLALSTIAVVAALISLSACRTTRRATGIEGNTAGMAFTLLNLQEEDQNNPNVVPELHRCSNGEVLQGTFAGPTKVTFPAKGLKIGTVCEVRLTYPNAPKERYLFLAEPDLLYIAPNVVISRGVTGEMQATAILAKRYNLNLPVDPAKSFSILADVEFPSDVSGSAVLINAQLSCDPQIASVTGIQMTSGTQGRFTFVAPIDPQVTAHVCAAVNVFVNGNWQFQGKLNDGKGTTITPTPAGKIPADSKVIKLVAIPPPQASGVTVTTTDGGTCKEGEVFDTLARKCVAKPAR